MVRAPGWEGADLSSIRTGVVGGGLVPESLLRAYLDRGVSLLHGYGLTEASPVVSLVDEREAAARTGSVGKPLPFVDVRAVRPDGSACEAEEIGEWWIRGPNVSEGYWRRPPVRDADGWFPTGDVGSIDAEGYLTFLDRASAAMRVGGAVVYPATIERALYGVPGLTDSAAVAIDGRIVAAVVAEAPSRPFVRRLRHTRCQARYVPWRRSRETPQGRCVAPSSARCSGRESGSRRECARDAEAVSATRVACISP
jgi:fatty-acyl-CoA synthase